MKKLMFLASILLIGITTMAQEQPAGISVTGEGTVKVVPDEVLIQINVNEEGKSAQEVKAAADKTIDAVLKYLGNQKIDKKNVQTEYVRLGKAYQYQTKTYNYSATQSISILLKDISEYDKIMQGLLELGINGINSVQFKSSEMEKHQSEARKKAVENAKMKAEEYASALKVRVGSVISLQEVTNNNYGGPQVYRAMEMKSADASSQKETLAVGEMEITSKVDVNFSLIN
jgi:uncharacterized protein YggE